MMKYLLLSLSLLTGLTFYTSCAQKPEELKMIYELEENYKFPYSIYEADKKFELKEDLREISGLAYYNDHSLLCVNDEKGIIYKYHLAKEKITKKYVFDRSGDYEGIEVVGDQVYVLRSDGALFEVDHFRKKNVVSVKNKTLLNAGNDTEGLAYDAKNNTLLVACKGSPGKDRKLKGNRAIYEYKLDKNKLSHKPKYLIDQEEVRKTLEFNSYTKFSVKLLEKINPSEGDLTFQPSAIAVHPITGNLYVVGSVGKLLIVLKPTGELLAIVKLKRKLFRQPEGICFAPDGRMFISNEGKGSRANIYEFAYLK